MNTNIMAYHAYTVKAQNPTRYKKRMVRQDLTIQEIEPAYRAMARHIDNCQ